MQRVIFIFIFLLFNSSTYADSPPCWCKFEEESANKKYVAIVDRPQKDSLIDPSESIWTLTVYERTAHGNGQVWQTKYDYSGYPGGLISDDGQTFTYVEFWYYAKSPQVDIYRQGKKINTKRLKGLNFKISEDKLVETISHHRWLWDEGNAYGYKIRNNKLHLEIRTIDGRLHYIDIVNGRFSSFDRGAANTGLPK
jgi:hypothetical protein